MDISLLSTIDRGYQVPFEILASSLLSAKRASTAIEWHVFTDDVTCDWQPWLARLRGRHGGDHATFILHQMDALAGEDLPLRGRAKPIMYARLLAPDRLAALASKVLYLDVDMIVLRPIEDLWSEDLGPHVCACCQDLAIPTVSSGMAIRDHQKLGLDPDSPYFNAGVMLIDTRRWKEQAIGQKALAYLASHFEAVSLFDQEALNVALAMDWRRLSYRWNLIASVAGRSFLDTTLLRRDDYDESLLAPHIVHYAGTLKPWLNPFLRGRWFDLYRNALRQALPAHEFHSTLRHFVHATYDGSVRRWTYPLERTAWQILRGF
jgi:lipopolysaccharide biosynthesis glycosyltransferase